MGRSRSVWGAPAQPRQVYDVQPSESAAAPHTDECMVEVEHDGNLELTSHQLDRAASRVLRLVLGSPSPLQHHHLRAKFLGVGRQHSAE